MSQNSNMFIIEIHYNSHILLRPYPKCACQGVDLVTAVWRKLSSGNWTPFCDLKDASPFIQFIFLFWFSWLHHSLYLANTYIERVGYPSAEEEIVTIKREHCGR